MSSVATVGYFEGTDPLLLSTFAAEGIETLPVANTIDGHGKNVNQLSKGEVNVVVGYLHKVVPAETMRTALLTHFVDKTLSTCRDGNIPVLLITSASHRDKAKAMLGDKANIRIVSPEEVETQIRKHL